jgi:hypothetical protein
MCTHTLRNTADNMCRCAAPRLSRWSPAQALRGINISASQSTHRRKCQEHHRRSLSPVAPLNTRRLTKTSRDSTAPFPSVDNRTFMVFQNAANIDVEKSRRHAQRISSYIGGASHPPACILRIIPCLSTECCPMILPRHPHEPPQNVVAPSGMIPVYSLFSSARITAIGIAVPPPPSNYRHSAFVSPAISRLGAPRRK